MGQKTRFMIKKKQKRRRRSRLKKLRDKQLDVKEYFCDGCYLGPRKTK
ncbi:MAG: hypothetical protein HQ575_01290 [Candidatus Omnitrophica bacterium]|nr:hypothetical protein [Candidatus Omnitrophota bacterium]